MRRAAGIVLALLCLASPVAAGLPDAKTLLDRLEAAWRDRNAEAYLELWDFDGPEARQREVEFTQSQFAWRIEPSIPRPETVSDATESILVRAQTFSVAEPRGVVAHWLFRLRKRAAGWVLVSRDEQGRIDGLVHLSLDPRGWKADGLRLKFEDFDLEMRHGTLFTAPEALGPTVLVFVGEAFVRISPHSPTEQDQLRQFCGAPELRERVRTAFVRIHPADFHHVLQPWRLESDPEAPRRLASAMRFFEEQSARAFVLDAALPGSPWWLVPPLGDSVIAFETARRGTLSFSVSSGEVEGVSLFDRAKRRQICLYAAAGRTARYNEDEGRAADVLSHDLRLRFEPSQRVLAGEDTLRIRLLNPSLTLRLRLDQALRVESVTSVEGGRHIYFRVRNQDSLMISLGPLAGRTGELSLTIRYSGALTPEPIERELIQIRAERVERDAFSLEHVLVYTNRSAWYPQPASDDYATATLRFDVPMGYGAVTGGLRTADRLEGERSIVEYRQDQPGKYITAAVGRLRDVGEKQEGPVTIHGYGVARTAAGVPALLARAAEIVRFFSEEFGPCPYPALNLVAVEGETPGGHSPPGMIVLSERPMLLRSSLPDDPGSVSSAPDFFLAHELAHQWWGHGVAGENYHERWLSEGAAQYAAALWIRQSRGEAAFREVLQRMGRWARRSSSEGPISLGYRLGHLRQDPQVFRAVVYDKGAYVLHMLRAIVGEEPFRAALRTLQAERRFTKIGTDDLRVALETASGASLLPYFDSWIHGTALPRLRLLRWGALDAQGRTLVEVEAEGLPGPVPLEIALTHEGGRRLERVRLGPSGSRFALESPSRVRKVEINTDLGLLAEVRGP